MTPLHIAAYFSPLSGVRHPTGVGQHVLGMYAELARDPRVALSLLSTRAEYQRVAAQLDPSVRSRPVASLPFGERTSRILLSNTSLLAADRYAPDADWVYCPKEQPVHVRRARLATTVHDLLPFELDIPGLPRTLPAQRVWQARRNLQRLIRRSSVILAVSEFTRQRLKQLFDVPESQVVVVGNGVSPAYFRDRDSDDETVLAKYGVERDAYLMAVGSLTRRKGGDLLIEVASRLGNSPAHAGLKILVAGRRHDPDLLEQFRQRQSAELGRPLALAGYVPEDDLAVLLSNSRGLLFPSRYEGFGIPLLEGMAAGVPVLAADSSSLPEIAGGYARLVQANSIESLGEGVRSLLDEPAATRLPRLAASREYARRFSWQSCADRLVSALLAR